jgi:hypothetical protein
MFDEEDLRRMSPRERMALRRKLAAIDRRDVLASTTGERRRAIFLIVIIVCCVCLAAWTGLLATTLPRFYRAGGWRGAWVGFDIALLAAFAATGWAAWRRRQLLIICLIVLATLLCCDAWFDVVLDARTSGFYLSLASALVIELPLAALAIFLARRLLRMTNAVMLRYLGVAGSVPRLRDIPLIGIAPGRPLSDLLAGSAEDVADDLAAEHADSGPGR